MNTMKAKTVRLRELLHENSQYLNKVEKFEYLPLKEDKVEAFENQHKIVLPKGYRDFLLHIGNGGLGPGAGILPLDLQKTYSNLHNSRIDPVAFNKLFRFDGKGETLEVFTDRMDQVFMNEKSDAALLYKSADNGQLCIGDAGGGTYFSLIVQGENQGEVWINALVSDGGFVKQASSFDEWYTTWLNQKIQSEQKKNDQLKELFPNISQQTMIPQTEEELHAFIGKFNGLKDKQPVVELFRRLLKEKKNPQPGVLKVCIDYTIHHPKYVDYGLALQMVKKASDYPDKEWAKTLLCQEGAALAGLGQFQRAITCFEKALECKDEEYNKGELDTEYRKLLCFCHLKLEQSERTLLAMVYESEIYDIDTVVSLLDDCYHMHKDYMLAAKYGQLLLDWELFQEDEESEEYLPDIYLTLIYSHAMLKNQEQVHRHMGKLIQIRQNEEMVPYENIAEQLIQAKCYSIALQCLESYSSFSRAQENLQVLFNLKGCCYAELGSYEEAIACFLKSFDIHRWIVPYVNLVRCYIELEKYEQAQQLFDEIIDFDSLYSYAYYQFALYYIKLNKENKALKLIEKAVTLGFDKNETTNNAAFAIW